MRIPTIFFLALTVSIILNSCQPKTVQYSTIMGLTQGTTYTISYEGDLNRKAEIDSVLESFDKSLSAYIQESTITAINENRTQEMDSLMEIVIEAGIRICNKTNGAFDMTIGPVVNAWGFGFKHKDVITPRLVDSLLRFTGCNKIRTQGNLLIKEEDEVVINVNAIAQGFSVDVVASFLERKGIKNYMVEIGGEIKTKGQNASGKLWQIGLNKPIDDTLSVSSGIQVVLEFSGMSLATSGNYRKYYIHEGQKFSHTIDPGTGYPVQHNLLSATVVSESCMEADAYATAFMVMGKERAMQFLENHDKLDAYFISEDKYGNYIIDYTPGFEQWLRK